MTRSVAGTSVAVTIEEAAVRTGIPVRTIDEWCRSGRLPSSRAGSPGHVLVRVDDLVAFLGDLAVEADVARRPGAREAGAAAPQRVPASPAPSPTPDPRREAALHAALARHSARLHWLEDFSLRLDGLALGTVEALARAAMSEIDGLVESDSSRFYLVDADRSACVRIAGRERVAEYEAPETNCVSIGTGFTGWVAEHAVPLLLTDASRDPRTAWSGGAPEPFSVIAVPLIRDAKAAGVLVLTRAGAGRFDPEDLSVLVIAAAHVGKALRNVEAHEALESQRTTLERLVESRQLLTETMRRLAAGGAPGQVLTEIALSLARLVEHDALAILRVDRAAGLLRPVASVERGAAVAGTDPMPIDAGLSGWVIAHGERAVANDARDAGLVAGLLGGAGENAASVAVLPLACDGEVTGILEIVRFGEGRSFTDPEIALAEMFAAQASVALRDAQRKSPGS